MITVVREIALGPVGGLARAAATERVGDDDEVSPTRASARPRLKGRGNRYFARNELSRLCLGVLRTAAGELLSTDEIAGQVIETKGFDAGDAILRTAIREQVGSTIKRLHREGIIESLGSRRASKWKLTGS
jgi:hypothetical protein